MSRATEMTDYCEATLISKAQSDPAFRKLLLSDPRAAVEQELGVSPPAGFDLKVVEETSTTNYLVLPVATEFELSDEDLDNVAGGRANLLGMAGFASVRFYGNAGNAGSTCGEGNAGNAGNAGNLNVE